MATVCAALAGTQLAGVPVFGMVKDAKHRTRGLVDAAGREIALALHRGPFTFITVSYTHLGRNRRAARQAVHCVYAR